MITRKSNTKKTAKTRKKTSEQKWAAERPTKVATRETSMRLPVDLLNLIDAFAIKKSKETGLNITRSKATIYLLRASLVALWNAADREER